LEVSPWLAAYDFVHVTGTEKEKKLWLKTLCMLLQQRKITSEKLAIGF